MARKAAKKVAKKPAAKRAALAPTVAPGSPSKYRARVRMYRQGLGDCFLITFPRKGLQPFQILIDCGVLARDKAFMTQIVTHIRDTVRNGKSSTKAKLDVVVATHEHKDHLSGFNQARELFNQDFDFGAVWLGWTENLTKPEIKKIKDARKKAIAKLEAALRNPRVALAADTITSVKALLKFSSDDDNTNDGKIADALEYLKVRGKDAKDLRYLEPGVDPITLEGLDDIRVYVLGPPKDPILLKGSEVTEKMKREGIIYHLSQGGEAALDALSVGLASGGDERRHPFSVEHRIARSSPYFPSIKNFIDGTYDEAKQKWRNIDHDWLNAFGQLALDLDNDTNNTSLVLAFEFVTTGEVLLFVGDAQVGNWQSWAAVSFAVEGRNKPLPAHDLLSRTVFYKVGHHCSHNATLRKGGLELMTSDDLVAFIPLDIATAQQQGKHGWDMPAAPLFKALNARASRRVVISDRANRVGAEAKSAGVVETDTYIDYFLK